MTIDQNLTLAAFIAQSRQQQQLSREALSGLAGLSVSFIRDAERDPSSCSFGKLQLLCAALGMNIAINIGTTPMWPQTRLMQLKAQISSQPSEAES